MRVIPDIRKEKLEDAQEILDKAKIKYKDEEEKEFSLKVRRGRVIRTEPEIGEKIKNDEEITIYVSRLWLLPIIILLLIMFLFMFTTIGLSNIKPSNTPKIAKKGEGWVKEELVYVVKDVDLERLDYYEYCISEKKNMKSCEWKATKTKNALVSETGEWYVQFRGVYQDKTKSRKSNKLKVYVDNDAPVVKKVTKETTDSKIHITMSATDKGSGINKYYYKVGDGEWKEADKDFTIKGLDPNKEYNITVKVEDKAGNEYTVEFKATTKAKDKDKDKDNNSQDNSNNNGNNENNNNNDNNANNDNNGDNNPNNPSDNNNGKIIIPTIIITKMKMITTMTMTTMMMTITMIIQEQHQVEILEQHQVVKETNLEIMTMIIQEQHQEKKETNLEIMMTTMTMIKKKIRTKKTTKIKMMTKKKRSYQQLI